MKILSYLLSACLISFSFVGFTGCSDDDPKDPNDPNNPEAPVNPNTPDANQPVVTNPVTGLTTRYGSKWKFNYSNGKMVSGTNSDGSSFSFGANPFTITSKWEGEYGYDKEVISNIRLNQNGYITSANYLYEGSETYAGETETWKYTGTITVSYINNEYINKIIMNAKVVEDGEECGTEHDEFTFTWNEGNLITVNTKYHSEDIEEGIDDGNSLTTFNYSSGQLNSGIYLSDFYEDITGPYFWYAGLLGKPSKQIPTHVSYIDEVNDETPYTYNYNIRANYNGDATVSSITLLTEDGYEYDNNIQFFYGGAYPNFDDEEQYQLNQAVKKSFARKHSARRK